MIKYFIRTTLERKLDKSISRELGEDYTLLVDAEHKPVESFIKQLSIISEYDSVLLEDDVILCRNFKQRIEEVISKYKDKMINFFTNPSSWFKTKENIGCFSFNQCTYYPKGISKLLAEKIVIFKNWNKIGYDLLMNKALVNLNISHIQYRPCLVQHIDIKSLLPFQYFKPRRCIYFIDYLEELNIPYEKAYKPENKQKLITLMKEKFKSINNEKD